LGRGQSLLTRQVGVVGVRSAFVSESFAEPSRRLSGLPALALVAGSMLGIGIFISPHQVAALVHDEWVFVLMWLGGGLTALCGALCLAELGAMMPRSGGDYSYLRLGWGNGVAFAAGWLQLLAIFPGSLATIALATATYQLPVLFGPDMAGTISILGMDVPCTHLAAAFIIVGLTAVNHVGVKLSGWLQIVVTMIPLVVLLVASLAVLFAPGGPPPPPEPISTGSAGSDGSDGSAASSIGGVALAYLPIYFAYSGWNAAIYIGAEIHNPGRNLPRALIGGTVAVTALYVVLCFGFLEIFGLEGLAGVGEAGTASAQALFGDRGIAIVTSLIFLAMMGSLNGSVLTGSRVGFAMARQGDCLEAVGELDARYGTPSFALWLQAALALALLLLGSHLESLIAYTTSAMLITGTLTVLTVVVLRHKLRELERPYRTWLYPIPPLVYGLSSITVLVVLAVALDPSVLFAFAWFAAALLFYGLRRRRRRAKSGNLDGESN